MADALFVFLSATPGAGSQWWRVAGERLIARGDDLTQIGHMPGERVIALLPASLCPIEWQSVPMLPPAQRDAVLSAQLLAAQSLASDDVHLVAGDAEGELAPVARIDREWLRAALAPLAASGFVPALLLPAALLAREGETIEIGDEQLTRMGPHAFVAEPALCAALGGDDRVVLAESRLIARLIAQSRDPVIDLRRREFAPAPAAWLDAYHRRAILCVGAALALLTLLIPAASLIRLNQARAAVDAQTRALVQPLFAGAPDPQVALAAALRARQGPGAGFLPSAAAVTQAILALPDAELGEMRFDPSGRLRIVARLARGADRTRLIAALEAQGLRVMIDAQSVQQGRTLVTLSLTAA